MEPTWLFIFSFGLKLVHVGASTFVCNREVLNRDFLVQILAPSVCMFTLCEFNMVGQGRSCFSLKLLTNNYKLNVFGSFLVHPDLKDFKSLFIIGEFLVALLSINV